MVDNPVYRARITIILGLMALHALICRVRNEENRLERETAGFVEQHRQVLHLWGETAVPYFALLAFYLERRVSSRVGEDMLGGMLSIIAHQNRPREQGEPDESLSDPYSEIDDAIGWSLGIRREPEWNRPSYDAQAYSHRALVMLLARRLRRELLATSWYDISDVSFVEMVPARTLDDVTLAVGGRRSAGHNGATASVVGEATRGSKGHHRRRHPGPTPRKA